MTQFLTRDINSGLLTEIIGLSNSDAFGRQRTSTPETIFDLSHTQDKQPIFIEEILQNGATTTHLPNESCVRMDVTTAVGSRAVRQSKRYFRYQPGKSLYVLLSGVLALTTNTGITTRIGYFDDDTDKTVDAGGNGLFFEYSNGTVKIVKRSYTTGAQVDTAIAQGSWSEGDQLDGLGASGIILDPTKAQIFWWDIEWLGVGTVRCGIFHNGQSITLHKFHHANIIASTYMTRASLPVRYEINQVTGTAAASMKHICSTVISEGGHTSMDRTFSRPMESTVAVGTALSHVMSIRLRNTYNRGIVVPLELDLLTTSNNAQLIFSLIIGGTVTGGTWLNHDANNSGVEYNVNATGITGGRVVSSGFVGSVNRIGRIGTSVMEAAMGASIAGVQEIITVAALTTTLFSANTYGSLTWQEGY